jgi:hypothetical protein
LQNWNFDLFCKEFIFWSLGTCKTKKWIFLIGFFLVLQVHKNVETIIGGHLEFEGYGTINQTRFNLKIKKNWNKKRIPYLKKRN